jgi:hypothetical protein
MSFKETELARLLALGYEEHELTWVPEGSPVSVDLVFMHGQDAGHELNMALDKMQSGQWVISHAGVERVIRLMPGCEGYSVKDALKGLRSSPFLRSITGSRRAKT